jgi:hypothetical protein
MSYVLFLIATILAGAINALAGGGGASREPHSCSIHRDHDRFCRVSLLLLEVVRPDYGAGRRRIAGGVDFEDPR